ncbi:hypothetical protein ACFL6I_10100 [candidate division KSB1 bacterium]
MTTETQGPVTPHEAIAAMMDFKNPSLFAFSTKCGKVGPPTAAFALATDILVDMEVSDAKGLGAVIPRYEATARNLQACTMSWFMDNLYAMETRADGRHMMTYHTRPFHGAIVCAMKKIGTPGDRVVYFDKSPTQAILFLGNLIMTAQNAIPDDKLGHVLDTLNDLAVRLDFNELDVVTRTIESLKARMNQHTTVPAALIAGDDASAQQAVVG